MIPSQSVFVLFMFHRSVTEALYKAAYSHNTSVFLHFRPTDSYVCHEGGAFGPGGACFVPLNVWKCDRVRPIDWPQAAPTLTKAGLQRLGGGMLLMGGDGGGACQWSVGKSCSFSEH